MKMVAQIIEAGYRSNTTSNGLGMKRQVFFVQVGGYDLHTGQTNNAGSATVNNAKVIIGAQASLFAELSQSMNAFQNAMIQIGSTYADASFRAARDGVHPRAISAARCPATASAATTAGAATISCSAAACVNGQRTYGKFPALGRRRAGRHQHGPVGFPRRPWTSSRRRWPSGSAWTARTMPTVFSEPGPVRHAGHGVHGSRGD